jgi:hypothetical protein
MTANLQHVTPARDAKDHAQLRDAPSAGRRYPVQVRFTFVRLPRRAG